MSNITKTYTTNITPGGDDTAQTLKKIDPEITLIYEWLTDLRGSQPSTASTRPANPNTYDCTYDTDDGLLYRWNGSAWAAQTINSLNVPLRQTVLTGPFNSATGTAELFSTSGSNLQASLDVTSIQPAVISFMDGFDASGAADLIARIETADADFWPTLVQNTTNYLYFDYTAGVLTGGNTVIAPIYSFFPPAHSAGLHWINVNTGLVQESNGTSWTKRNRVFCGECVTNLTGVTSKTIYPYNSNHNLSTDGTFANNSDFIVPSEKAIGEKIASTVASGTKLPFALEFSISPTLSLWSSPFVMPCSGNFSRCDVLCKVWSNNAAESPNQATTITMFNFAGNSLDDVTFTTGSTTDATWNFHVPANDVLQCKASGVNNLTGTISAIVRGVRTNG